MARTFRPLSGANGDACPQPIKAKWQQVAETLADAGRGHRPDTFCFTVIGTSALFASAFGHAGIYPLVFAGFFMLLVPALRFFKLIDSKRAPRLH